MCICESDLTSRSTAAASLVLVSMHVRTAEWLRSDQRPRLQSCLIRETNRILSPVHYLLYVWDPFFLFKRRLRQHVRTIFPVDDIYANSHCHSALRTLATEDGHYDALLSVFMQLTIAPNPLLSTLRKWHPRYIWSQLQDLYPVLSALHTRTYKWFASTSGIDIITWRSEYFAQSAGS